MNVVGGAKTQKTVPAQTLATILSEYTAASNMSYFTYSYNCTYHVSRFGSDFAQRAFAYICSLFRLFQIVSDLSVLG